jgi:hypothetical protein
MLNSVEINDKSESDSTIFNAVSMGMHDTSLTIIFKVQVLKFLRLELELHAQDIEFNYATSYMIM